MSFATVQATLASQVANGGTVAVPYPTGMVQADFTGINAAVGGSLALGQNVWAQGSNGVAISYGASDITITNNTGAAWAAGSVITVSLDRASLPLLTDNSGGSASATIAAIGGTYSQAEVRNAIASLAGAVNLIMNHLRANRPARDY